MRYAAERLDAVLPRVRELPLGGTAVGTGINTPPGFAARVIEVLGETTGQPFTEARDHFGAQGARDSLVELSGVDLGVIVSDSFGRAWRQGTTDVALGVAGVAPLRDLRGARDARGRELRTTQIAVADELAGAAELVMGKARGIPAAIVRGVDARGDGSAAELVMPRERDLFR